MKSVLIITRPAPDGARFAGFVRDAVNVEILLSPLLEIVPLAANCDADEVVFTSTNGVAQAERLGLKRGRAWCVGDRTAQLARQAGFDAISAQGTVEDVLAMILAEAPRGKLAHIRGKEVRGDLGPRLRAAGIDCVDAIAYEQRPLLLRSEAKLLIEGARPVIMPLFSPRSAVLLMEQVVLGPNVAVLAMSAAVAKMLPENRAVVIDAPTGAAMLAAVTARIRTE